MQSEVRLEGFSRFDFDADALKKVLRVEGKQVAKIARRLISRNAISKAGEFSGRQTGLMKKSIRAKVSRSGQMVVITHILKSTQARYPFMLAYGVKKNSLRPRADHIAEAMKQRRNTSIAALRSALHRTIKVK